MRKLILTTFIVATGFTLKAQNSNVQDYINQYKDIAIAEQMRTGVPASITLAQGILESGSGNSKLAKYSNNHFGIKCKKEWTGNTVYQDDDIKNECFRVYQTAADSYKDHSDFLKNRPYYTDLFTLDPTDYKGWAKGLKKDGYATERDYPKNLIGLVEKYNLQQYAEEALTRIAKGEKAPENQYTNASATINNEVATKEQNESPKANTSIALFENSNENANSNQQTVQNVTLTQSATTSTNYTVNQNTCTLLPNAYPTGFFKINKTKVTYLKKGSSLFALASNQNMSYNKLLEYNDLEAGTDILLKDRLVYLERKPKKGDKEMHIVANGESMDEIAQKEGVQLNSLVQYNHVGLSSIPLPGENIYLRSVSPTPVKVISNNTLALD